MLIVTKVGYHETNEKRQIERKVIVRLLLITNEKQK